LPHVIFAFAETLQIGIEHSDYLAPVSQIDNIAPQMTNRNPTMLPSNNSRYQAGVSYEQASRPPQKDGGVVSDTKVDGWHLEQTG
jgi:hypothetical protein